MYQANTLYTLNYTMLYVNYISKKRSKNYHTWDEAEIYHTRSKRKKIVIKTDPDMKLEEKDFKISMIPMLKVSIGGFPGGTVVENLPVNAGDTGSSPGLGRSHMPWNSWAREPQLLSLCIWSLCSATREATIVRGPRTAMKSGPRLPQLEKALAQKRRPNTAINK